MRVAIVLLVALVCCCAAQDLQWTSPSTGKHVTGRLQEKLGGWPQCDAEVRQFSGYFLINASTNKNYFYWAFSARSRSAKAPLILWMTGGPGCSSTLAMFAENGPCGLHKNGSIYRNDYGWNDAANIVYIDQPAAVGYSYSTSAGYDHNEKEVSEDMFWFVQALYKAHPEWQSNEFFIFGESYGGHYAPATAHRVWQGNRAKEGLIIPLKGLAVGNGLTDPLTQYQYFPQMAWDFCQKEIGKPCVSKSAYESMKSAVPGCVKLIKACANGDESSCSFARMNCNGNLISPYQMTGKNVYDIRGKCEVPPLCYDFSAVTTFLNRADVKKALGARSDIKWESCNMQINGLFTVDWFQSFATTIPDLLASNIRVLIYAGEDDYICNWIGNKEWTKVMVWPGKDEYNKASDLPWMVDGKEAGLARSVKVGADPIGFTFLAVHQAGHMVPMDQPKRSLDMIARFMNGTKFQVRSFPLPRREQ